VATGEEIAEFLIPVRLKFEESSEGSIDRAMTRASFKGNLFSQMLIDGARAAEDVVQKVAHAFRELGDLSERAKVPADNIRKYQYAAEQMGVSYAQVKTAMENIGAFERSHPGWLKKRFGGNDLETIGKYFSQMPAQSAEFLNKKLLKIPEELFLAIQKGDFGKFAAEGDAIARRMGVNMGEAVKASTEFERSMTRLAEVISAAATPAITSALDSMADGIDSLGNTVERYGKPIGDFLNVLAKGIRVVLGAIPGYDYYHRKHGKKAKGEGEKDDPAKATERNTAELAEQLKRMEQDPPWVRLLKWLFGMEAKASGGPDGLAGGGSGVGPGVGPDGGETAKAVPRGAGGASGSAVGGGGSGGGGGVTRSHGDLAANQQKVISAAKAEGLDETSAKALAANLSGEALSTPGIVNWDVKQWARGAAQWDPPRSARIKAKFGKFPNEMTVEEQTRASLWELKTHYPGIYARLVNPRSSAEDKIRALVDWENPRNKAGALRDRMRIFRGIPSGGAAASRGGGSTSPDKDADLDIAELGRELEKEGLRVSEHPDFGGVAAGVHHGRGHAEGRAIDVNIGKGMVEADDPESKKRFDALAEKYRKKGYNVIFGSGSHRDHMHIETPPNRTARRDKTSFLGDDEEKKSMSKPLLAANRDWSRKTDLSQTNTINIKAGHDAAQVDMTNAFARRQTSHGQKYAEQIRGIQTRTL
jgi:hypothetical protein